MNWVIRQVKCNDIFSLISLLMWWFGYLVFGHSASSSERELRTERCLSKSARLDLLHSVDSHCYNNNVQHYFYQSDYSIQRFIPNKLSLIEIIIRNITTICGILVGLYSIIMDMINQKDLLKIIAIFHEFDEEVIA